MADYNIAQAFEEIENELIDSMMRNFSRHRAEEEAEGYLWSQWQAEQLKSLEQYRRRNAKKFNRQFSQLNGKVADMLKKARADGSARQEASILSAIKNGFKPPKKPSKTSSARFFKLNDRKLEALIKATTDDLRRAETAILRMSNDKYRKAIFNAQVYANTGAGTYEKAVDMACRDMLRAGLNCVEYSNGARHTLEDYARMAIRTANKRAYLYGEGQKRQEWGISTVTVNSRRGGCPLCTPYIGKIFIDDVYSGGKKTGGEYPLLSDAIKSGLFHPNCKDSTSTYYEGITTLQPVTKEEQAEMERREQLEERQSYYENQAKKNRKIAEYSLDADNKKTYSHRAEVFEQKAQNAEKTLANLGESGIIKEQKHSSVSKTASNNKKANKATASKISKSESKTVKSIDYSNVGSRSFSEEARTRMFQQERIIAENKFETGILYDSDGKIFFSKKGTSNEVKFTKAEISKMKGCTLTHNHPDGTVFSPNDIDMMRQGGLAEIRACNSKGAYVLRSNSDWNSDIASWADIEERYWECMNEVGMKYRDIAAQEGKHIFYYQKQMDEDGLILFSKKYGLEFSWEEKI